MIMIMIITIKTMIIMIMIMIITIKAMIIMIMIMIINIKTMIMIIMIVMIMIITRFLSDCFQYVAAERPSTTFVLRGLTQILAEVIMSLAEQL